MSTFKKALSLMLSIVMIFTTVAIGLTFSASAATTTVKSYADVQAEATAAAEKAGTTDTNFVYVATEFYRADGTLLGHNDTVQEGETLTCKVFFKTSYAVYNSGSDYSRIALVLDNELFDMADFYDNYESYMDFTYVRKAGVNVEQTINTTENHAVLADEVAALADGSRYGLVILPFVYASKATDTLVKNQITFDPTQDTTPLTTFTIKVKSSVTGITAGTDGKVTGFAKIPATFYHSNPDVAVSTSYGEYPSALSLGGTATANKKAKAAYFEADGDYNFTISKDRTVTFTDAAGNTVATETVEAGGNASAVAASALPANFYMWKDAAGNFIANADLKDVEVDDNITFTAVLTTDTVAVSFDPNGGTLTYTEGGTQKTSTETVTVNVPVTGFNIGDYTAALSGTEFKTWVDADNAAVSGTVVPASMNTVTYKAKWDAGVAIMVKTLPTDDKPEGEWVEACSFDDGEFGKTMTADDVSALVALVNANYENIGKLIGAADEELDFGFRAGSNLAPQYLTALGTDRNSLMAFKTDEAGTSFSYSKTTFGADFTVLYLQTAVSYTVNAYLPDSDTVSYTTTFRFYSNDGYKNASNYGYDMAAVGSVTTANILGSYTYDTNQYNLGYIDGNKTALTVSTGSITLAAKPNDPEHNNANGHKGSIIEIHAVLTDKVYRFGFNVGDTSKLYTYSSEGTFNYGDSISYADLAKVYVIYGNGYNTFVTDTTTGGKLEGTTDSFYESLAGIPYAQDAFSGYKLQSIEYTDAEGTTADFRDAGTVTLDTDFIDQCSKYTMDDGSILVCLPTTRVIKEYHYNLWYQDTTVGNWVKIVDQQAFTGDNKVAYSDFATTEVAAVIKASNPESLVSLASFSLEKDGKSASIRAYAAEGKTDAAGNEDSMDLYVIYTASTRYAFVSYNNEYDESGNLNTAKFTFTKAAEDSTETDRYKQVESTDENGKTVYSYVADADGEYVKSAKSGVVYDRSTPLTYNTLVYAADVAGLGEDAETPYYNTTISSFKPVTDPTYTETTSEDDDGNEVVTVTDPKGTDNLRPYRDCEFNGWKLYYVDGVYSSYDELPDRSEWHEVNMNSDNLSITTTTILEAQWISDSGFKFRVYDDQGNLSYARTGNIFKGTSYYWDTTGTPCKKGENVLVEDSDTFLCIWLRKTTDPNGSTYYYKPLTIARTFLDINVTTAYVPVILELVKSLMKKGTLDLDDLLGGLFS